MEGGGGAEAWAGYESPPSAEESAEHEMGAEHGAAAAAEHPRTRALSEEQRIVNGHARGKQAIEKLKRLRLGRARRTPCTNSELVGESTHKTIWSFAFKFEMEGETFYACHWDVEKCRSDQYIQPLWNPERGCVEGTEYNDHLLHLEKVTAVMHALDHPLKYILRIIEADLADAHAQRKTPKHVYHVYQEGKDSDEMLQRAMLPFQGHQNANMMQSIGVIRSCVAKGGNLKRLFSVLYRSERDVDKPEWDGRPRKAKRLNSTGAVSKEIRTACDPRAPKCQVCNHNHFQGTACPACGHVGINHNPVGCALKLVRTPTNPLCTPVVKAGSSGARPGDGATSGRGRTTRSSALAPASPSTTPSPALSDAGNGVAADGKASATKRTPARPVRR
eukprot:COSAG02_NODE_2070_length_9937_cov_21.671885_3_plen_390_part_00